MYTIKAVADFQKGYCFTLANGQRWHMIATEKLRSWLENLASIMELKTSEPNGYPKLIFIQKESRTKWWPELAKQIKQEVFPRNDWKVHNLKALQIWSHPDVPDIICEIGPEDDDTLDIIRMWLSLHPIYQRAQDSGGLPIHAALIERNGIGVLLAAPGDTGKSTCCHRLASPWQALCDDETLIIPDVKGIYFAHPFPTWSDYLWQRHERTWNVEKHVPLFAIFFLEQAATDEVLGIGPGQAAIFIYQSATQVYQRSWRNLNREEGKAQRKKVFENACELAKAIPAYKLRVSLYGHFWEEIEKVLS